MHQMGRSQRSWAAARPSKDHELKGGHKRKVGLLKGRSLNQFPQPQNGLLPATTPHPEHKEGRPWSWYSWLLGKGKDSTQKYFLINGANFQPSGVRTPRVGTGTISTTSLSWPLRVPSPKAPSPPLPPKVQPWPSQFCSSERLPIQSTLLTAAKCTPST